MTLSIRNKYHMTHMIHERIPEFFFAMRFRARLPENSLQWFINGLFQRKL